MGERKNLCVLVAEIAGGAGMTDDQSALEARHAIDRSLRRVDLAIEANGGTSIRRSDASTCAVFERCDPAVLAACEMLERVQNLPPVRGKRLTVQIGIHYGAVDTASDVPDEGEQIASQLAASARGGEALATGGAVMLLSAATRHFAKPESIERAGIDTLGWPVHVISRHPESVVSMPPATKLLQRLRIHHQEEIVFVDEQQPLLLFGRELGNDVAIMDPRASRQHARIERRRGGFVLIDYSSNGTFVIEEGGSERCVKGGETALIGPGRIGCGFSANEVERDLVFFEIV